MARNISLFKRIKNGFKEVITFDKRFFFNYKHNTTKNHFSIILFKTTKRGLAVLRILYALIVIGDLLDRARDLKAHYTDE